MKKLKTLFLIILMFIVFSVYADGVSLDENTFLPDGRGNIYQIRTVGKTTEVFKISPSEKKIYFTSGDEFDKAFCIDGEIYLTSNRQRFIYILTKDNAEIAEVSLDGDYTMTADENYFYFADSSKSVKYDIRTGESENINEFPEIPEISIEENIIVSGENRYKIADGEAVYVPEIPKQKDESKTEVSKRSELSKVDVSQKEVSKTDVSKSESKIEISVSERSKVSVKEPKVYDYTISSDVYEISEDVIYIPQGTTVAVFKKGMKYGDCKITFTNHNNKSVTSGQMGTGWRIDFSGDVDISYYTVVDGDVTGEGNINSRDIYLMRDYLFGKAGFTKYQELAADVKKNGIIDSVDMYMMKKTALSEPFF